MCVCVCVHGDQIIKSRKEIGVVCDFRKDFNIVYLFHLDGKYLS